MRFISSRALNLYGCIICCLLLLAAYYMQYVQGIQPCPLCILQRVVFYLLALVLLIAVLNNPRKRGTQIYGGITLVLAFLGVLLALRHSWLQYHPQVGADICLPGYMYVIQHMPFTEVWQFFLQSSENCSHVTKVLGLNIPIWTLLGFSAFCLLGILQVIRGNPK